MRDLQYMIDVMTAARDGKRIEVKGLSADSDDRWRIVQVNQHLVWNWSATDYRIAPEPYPLPNADPKFTQTIDISMRLCLDAEQNVYVDNWQVNNKRPHGSVGSVGSGSLAPEPRKARKAREWYVYYDDHRHEMRISHTPVMDTESGTYIKVREVIE